jgi:hypothetical protein
MIRKTAYSNLASDGLTESVTGPDMRISRSSSSGRHSHEFSKASCNASKTHIGIVYLPVSVSHF